MEALVEISKKLPLVFPMHPRTRARLEAFGLADAISSLSRIHLTRPISYVPFMSLVREARLIITDSGGVQEETTYLGIPCLTLRENTERPITIEQGTNRLTRADTLLDTVDGILENGWATGVRPALWDGRTAERVAESLRRRLATG
jgi:UDP-N-acetylglucosamine 2-epimerase (non-hydrolysing)